MHLFVFLFIFCSKIFANDLSTFETYKQNLPLLLNDISQVEKISAQDHSQLYLDMLDKMNLLKSEFDHLSNLLTLDVLMNDAKANNWVNIAKMTNELVLVCESKTSQDLAICKKGLNKIKSLAINSKLTDESKDSITTFIDDYSLQVGAMEKINADFVSRFNTNAEIINVKLKQPVIPNNLPSEEKQFLYSKTHLTNFFKQHQKDFFMLTLIIILLVSMRYFYLKVKNYRVIKDFHIKLFTLAKKNNLTLKVFGKLSSKEASYLSNIQLPFLNAIYLSRSVSNKANINFKNRSKNISIEVNYFTSRAIQNVILLPKEKNLKESIDTLQDIVEKCGGEFVFSNRFNSFGELIQSSFSMHLPK